MLREQWISHISLVWIDGATPRFARILSEYPAIRIEDFPGFPQSLQENAGIFSSPATRHGGACGERKCRSYSFTTSTLDGDEWSASRPGRALPPGKGPPVPIGQEAGWAPVPVWTQRLNSTLKLDHERFRPNPLQFIVHLSPFHWTSYSLSCWKNVVK
jgi:hypothetical protein